MKVKQFQESEVISFLEWKIINEEADDNEMELYEYYVWDGFISELNYNTYVKLKKEMLSIWEGK